MTALIYTYPTIRPPFAQATFMVRLPPLGLAVFHVYDSPDSPMTLRSDTLLRLSGRGAAARAADPLPVRSQQSDPQTFYISSQSLTLGFSGTTGLLEVCFLSALTFGDLTSELRVFSCVLTLIFWRKKPRVLFPNKPKLTDQSEHCVSCCYSNILSSIFQFCFQFCALCSLWLFHLQSIRRKDDPQEVKVQMQFMVYGTRPSKDKSGAYLFLPDGKAKVFSQLLYLRCLLTLQIALIKSPPCIG